jgi:integrase
MPAEQRKRRRQRGEGSVYQRKDGLWVGEIDLGWRDGKRRRKVVYDRTQRAAIKKLNDVKARIAKHGDIPTAGMRVDKWLETWLTEICPAKEKMRPNSLRNYRTNVNNYLIPTIGKERLDRLSPAHVRRVRTYIMDELGLSSTSAMHAHAVLSTALNDAKREGLVSVNVTDLVDPPKRAASDRRALSMPEVVALLEHVQNDRLGSRWLAALLLGARQGELLGLEWDRVDLQNGTADLSWQLQRIPYKHGCTGCGRRGADRCPQRVLNTTAGFEYRQLVGNQCLTRPKTEGSTRLVPLPAPLVTALETRHRLYLGEKATYGADHGLVWPRTDGRPMDAEADSAAWRTHLAAVGLPAVKQHAARHTAATLLLSIGVPQEIIMSILGHSDAVTTRGYQHIDLTMQRQALGQLASALGE